IDSNALACLNRVAHESELQEIFLLCTTTTFYQRELGEAILAARNVGVKVVLLAWTDLEDAVEKYVAEQSAATVIASAYLRTLEFAINAKLGCDTAPVTAADLASRSLPTLRHFLSTQLTGTHVLDVGAGRGRHTLLALALGYSVTAIDKQQRALDAITTSLSDSSYRHLPAPTLICGDFMAIPPETLPNADLVICTGVLHHVQSIAGLEHSFDWLRDAAAPWASIYIEMLFGMKLDGASPRDGRLNLSQEEFERALHRSFPAPRWRIMFAQGPSPRQQVLGPEPRSFFPTAKAASFTAVEYLLTAEA
ncbi:MAG: class I SAM-dependent methyltransferase, partial [Chthoniobacterales bacterium]